MIRLALVALAAVLAFSAVATARTVPTKRVAKAEQLSDGTSALANLKGRTLYSLSIEKHRKFICTAGCLSVWRPLVIPKDTKPTGPVALGTVVRPDGRTQVTYRGRPLYSFAEDKAGGEANGEGIEDVGTWHAAVLTAASTPQPTEPPTPYPTTPPTTSPPTTSPPQTPPAQPPYEYPPYNY